MKSLTCIHIFDLNNSGAPPAHSIDGMHAEPAVGDEPCRDGLSHDGSSDLLMLSEILQMCRRPLSPTPRGREARGNSGHMVTVARSFTEHARFTGLGIGPRLSLRTCENPADIRLRSKTPKDQLYLPRLAVWDGDGRRAAVANLLRLDGVVEVPCFPVHRQDVASIFDVERMAASFATAAPTKKKFRH